MNGAVSLRRTSLYLPTLKWNGRRGGELNDTYTTPCKDYLFMRTIGDGCGDDNDRD